MEGGPLLQDWWVEDSKNYVLYLNIMSHVEGHSEQDMLQKKGGRGFPYFVLMNDEGKVLIDFRPTDREALASATEFVQLQKKHEANPDDPDIHARWLMATLRKDPAVEQKAELDELIKSGKVSDAVKKQYEDFKPQYAISSLLSEFFAAMQEAGRDGMGELEKSYGKRALALYKDGTKPAGNDMGAFNFMRLVFAGAVEATDKDTAKAVYDWMASWVEGKSGAERFLESLKKQLDTIG